MSSVEIKVMTAVMTKKINIYNGLYGLSSLSSLKIHIMYADQSLYSVKRLHISPITRNGKGTYHIIYIVVFLVMTVMTMMTNPLTCCFKNTIRCHHSFYLDF